MDEETNFGINGVYCQIRKEKKETQAVLIEHNSKLLRLEEQLKMQDAALHDLFNLVMVMKQKVMKMEERR